MSKTTKAVHDTAQQSLTTLDRLGVAGAKEAAIRNGTVKESAVILNAVNPPGRSSVFDRLIRAVHQRELLRIGDIQLLLQSLGSDEAGLTSSATRHYAKTLRYAVFRDKHPIHATAMISIAITAISLIVFGIAHVCTIVPATPDLRSIALHKAAALLKRVAWYLFCIGASVSLILGTMSIVRIVIIVFLWKYPKSKLNRDGAYGALSVAFIMVLAYTAATRIARPFLFIGIAFLLVMSLNPLQE